MLAIAQTWTLMRRGLNEVIRVPGAAVPGILAPTIFALGLTAVFGKLTVLPGFSTDNYFSFLVAVSLLQAAAFTGAATGVNLARDIEQGWFDRLLASAAPRGVLLAGTVLSAALRVLLPVSMLLVVGFAFMGLAWPGLGPLLLAVALASTMAIVAACWGVTLALRFRTQQAAPLMQAGAFMATLFTTSYAPQHLLTGWLQDVARWNPVTKVLEGVRQGFVGEVTWADTWPALLAVFGLVVLFNALALRNMTRATD